MQLIHVTHTPKLLYRRLTCMSSVMFSLTSDPNIKPLQGVQGPTIAAERTAQAPGIVTHAMLRQDSVLAVLHIAVLHIPSISHPVGPA